MNNHTPLAHRLWFKYLTAAIAVSIAFGLRFWFLGGIGPAIPYLTFFPAVMLAAVVGGIGPGCLAICLSALLVVHFFIEPVGTYYLYVENHRDALGLLTFIAGGLMMVVLGEVMARRRTLLRQQAHELLQVNELFRSETLARQKTEELFRSETLARQEIEEVLRLADLRLRRNLERQSVTLQAVGDGIIAVDSQERIELMNPVAEQLTGWSQADAIGRPLPEVFRIINEETRAISENPVAKVLRLGVVIGLANHTLLIRKDGSETPIADSAAPVFGSSGETIGVVLVFRDQTEERRTAQTLETKATEAVAWAERSDIANKAKSEFLANMSHEIRTPLNGVIGMLQLIKGSGITDEVDSYADMALRAGQRLTSLLSDILDLSRMEAGRMPIISRPFALANIVTAVSETFSPMHFSKPLSLVISVAPGIPTAFVGDEIRVRQILFNLVGNAIKFTDKGEVRLDISSLAPPSADMARLLFTVSDTGIGIADDKLEQICQPFVQVSKDYTRSQQGAGLGLAITLRLVNSMQGTLTFDSTENLGTTVYLSLPFKLSTPDIVPVFPVPSLDGTALAPLCILLVEDDEINRMSARLTLEKMGHHVVTANNGVEAVEALRRSAYEVC